MSLRVRANLGTYSAATSKPSKNATPGPQIGIVIGTITTENTPTKELYEKYGKEKGIGTVFYAEYSKNLDWEKIDIKGCKPALPFHASTQNYPLRGEIVQLIDAPSPSSQVNSIAGFKYYTGTVNIWNNAQQNSPSSDTLGDTFVESDKIKKLTHFEGDRIYLGRKGNGLRFGSTVKKHSDKNEWSNIGEDGDPILILVNGYAFTDSEGKTHIEEVNKEKSSIYMTSTQKIPLIPGAIIKNPFLSSTPPENYFSPQILLNSDRIILNSKKDEVLIFAKSNIELSTDNVINFNAGEIIHLHVNEKNSDSRILLGTGPNGEIPYEPLLLGGQTHDVLLEMCNVLTTLAGFLSSVVIPTTEGGVVVAGCNAAGEQLLNDVSNLIDKLETIQSNKVYTI